MSHASRSTHTLGIISDTHGLLRPEAIEALRGVERILHAGDIGSQEVLAALHDIAPVTAVRGNVDREAWAHDLSKTEVAQVEHTLIYLIHNIEHLDIDPAAGGIHAVVYGHSHRPAIYVKEGILFFNPGAAGPRRFHLPATLGILRIEGGRLHPEIVTLEA